jgi:hypothetical protein
LLMTAADSHNMYMQFSSSMYIYLKQRIVS